ncbi:FRG domain-containing protein [Staphylococcus xylosus]|uniref:FRG domain-containing protein n=1 Tax=Staphylococcus xylosus TaxID=1288 RepID=UPI000853E70B|nr:FRG domain-containing protein [Staphylococcus xylosus]OEK78155.1 hypothetical protein AST16_09265 [Staphylococcus xylosus]
MTVKEFHDYNDLKNHNLLNELFDFSEIDVDIGVNAKEYKIENVDYKPSQSSEDIDPSLLQDKIDGLNKEIKEKSIGDIFFVLKNIFKYINETFENYNTFFRGQSNNWRVEPNILRNDVKEDFLQEFESIYYEMSNKFPKELDYIKLENNPDKLTSRANQLALLQHYGFRTTLVDITSNPFIALLFMCASGEYSLRKGVIDVFLIHKRNTENSKNVFIQTKETQNNKRLKAQSGAFLYFDKVLNIKPEEIRKIDCFRIKLKFSCETPKILKVSKKQPTSDLEFLENQEKELNRLSQTFVSLLEEKEYDSMKIREIDLKICQKYNLNLKVGDNYTEKFTILKKYVTEIKIKQFEKEKKTFVDNIEAIRKDILSELQQHYYFEEKLYPDLYNQTNFKIRDYLISKNKTI